MILSGPEYLDFGHGDILNHPALLAEKLKNEMI